MSKSVRIEQHGSLGVLWAIGWLFSIGYLKLGFWRGVLAFFVWPYFLGADIADRTGDAADAVAVQEPTLN